MAILVINEAKKKGTIAPEIYGHFSEHLGRCIYEGLYVGEDSGIENVEFCQSVTALKYIRNLGRKNSVTEGKVRARLGSFARSRDTFPYISAPVGEKEEFNSCSRTVLNAENTGRENTGVIQNQAVALTELVKNIVKMPMLNIPAYPVHNHEPRGVSRLDRVLCNQLFGQIIEKI